MGFSGNTIGKIALVGLSFTAVASIGAGCNMADSVRKLKHSEASVDQADSGAADPARIASKAGIANLAAQGCNFNGVTDSGVALDPCIDFATLKSQVGPKDIMVQNWLGSTRLTGYYDGTWMAEDCGSYGSINCANQRSVSFGVGSDIPFITQSTQGGSIPTFGVWRPSSGAWYLSGDVADYGAGSPSRLAQFNWGMMGDIPVSNSLAFDPYADNGSFSSGAAVVFRPSDGYWYTFGSGGLSYRQWGQAGDQPYPYVAAPVVYRPSDGSVWMSASPLSSNYTVFNTGIVGGVMMKFGYSNYYGRISASITVATRESGYTQAVVIHYIYQYPNQPISQTQQTVNVSSVAGFHGFARFVKSGVY